MSTVVASVQEQVPTSKISMCGIKFLQEPKETSYYYAVDGCEIPKEILSPSDGDSKAFHLAGGWEILNFDDLLFRPTSTCHVVIGSLKQSKTFLIPCTAVAELGRLQRIIFVRE